MKAYTNLAPETEEASPNHEQKHNRELEYFVVSGRHLFIWAKHSTTLSALDKVAKSKGLDLVKVQCSEIDTFETALIHDIGNCTRAHLHLPTSGKGILVFTDFRHMASPASYMCQCLVIQGAYGKYKLPTGWSLALAAEEHDEDCLTKILGQPVMSRLHHITLQGA